MIIAITAIVLILTSCLVLCADRRWKMSSYVWGLLGYPSAAVKAELRSDDGTQGQDSTSPQRDANGHVVSKEQGVAELGGEEGDVTPKSNPAAQTLPPVPVFSLHSADTTNGNTHHEEVDEEEEDNLPPPSFPALNSAQRTSGKPPQIPTLKPLQNAHSSTASTPAISGGLMAPPSLPTIRGVPSASSAAGLRVPSSGPLPNRSPGANTLATPLTTAVKTPNPRQKVQLKPGHSPLDWASLKRSGKNLSGVNSLVRVTPSMLKQFNGRKGRPAWSSYHGRVYNVTPYLPYHPGGEGELRRVAGKDGAKLFNEVHPWVNWENMLEGCLVGIMVSEGDGSSRLDDMD